MLNLYCVLCLINFWGLQEEAEAEDNEKFEEESEEESEEDSDGEVSYLWFIASFSLHFRKE